MFLRIDDASNGVSCSGSYPSTPVKYPVLEGILSKEYHVMIGILPIYLLLLADILQSL
jgi:hypothetical protein